MIETKINSDPISEKYRKYLLGVVYGKVCLYILHGADLTSENQDDKLLLDSQNSILAFKSMEDLRAGILQQAFSWFDLKNTLLWAKYYRGSHPYGTNNLDSVLAATDRPVDLDTLTESQMLELINFINLFGDYAYQTGNKAFLAYHKNRSIRTFFDFSYDNHIWDFPEHASYQSLQELDYLQFDEREFRLTIRKMVVMFMSKTRVS